MATSRYGFDEAKIAKRLKEGRGVGVAYLPWLTMQDVPSQGRSHRFVGRVTGRKHHLLSDLELRARLIYDWSDAVTDIREQFPLDRDDTRRIASAMGVAHPIDVRSKVDLVMTTCAASAASASPWPAPVPTPMSLRSPMPDYVADPVPSVRKRLLSTRKTATSKNPVAGGPGTHARLPHATHQRLPAPSSHATSRYR